MYMLTVSAISDGLSAVVGLVAPNPYSQAVDTDEKCWLGGNRGLVKHDVQGPADCNLGQARSGNSHGSMGPTVGMLSISCSGPSGLAGVTLCILQSSWKRNFHLTSGVWTKVELRPPRR